jgi:hypothetical protein
MTIEIFIILLCIGIATGILAGYFGVGGGIIIVPSLISIYAWKGLYPEFDVHVAVATSLFTIIFTTLSSSIKHARSGNVEYLPAVIIGLTSSVSVILLSKAAINLPGSVLKIIFSVLLLIIAVKMFFENSSHKNKNKGKHIYSKPLSSLIGIISGSIAAFTGLGGGVIIVPMMKYILRFNIKKAIGTSSAAILLTAIAGVAGYYLNVPDNFTGGKFFLGMVDTYSALAIIIGSVPFSQIGVYLNKKTPHEHLNRLFALFIIFVAVRMIFF